jgi:hypothetical protein
MSISKNAIAFKKLLELIFRQVDAGKELRLKRLAEFQELAPKPPRDFHTEDPRLAVAYWHDYLSNLASKLSASSPIWEDEEKSDFDEALSSLEEAISNAQVSEVNQNLVHFHRHSLLLASADFESALHELQTSTRIMKEYVSEKPEEFDVVRDIILNKGREVLIAMYSGDADTAVSLAFEMEKMASEWEETAGYEEANNLCPLEDWMRYYRCVALVSKQEGEKAIVAQKRQMAFDTAYTKKSYERWPMPSLFPILLSDEWKNDHGDIFQKVADRVYIGENSPVWRHALRKIAVRLGRRELRVAPTLLVAAIICFSVFSLIQDTSAEAAPADAVFEYVQQLPAQATDEELQASQVSRQELFDAANEIASEISAFSRDGFISVEELSQHILSDGDVLPMIQEGFDLAHDANERVIKGISGSFLMA